MNPTNELPPRPLSQDHASDGAENQIKVDGFGQVLAMLQMADSDFRESLLRRIAARDPNLAYSLRRSLLENDF